jgi:hypothetical protein
MVLSRLLLLLHGLQSFHLAAFSALAATTDVDNDKCRTTYIQPTAAMCMRSSCQVIQSMARSIRENGRLNTGEIA